MDNYAELLATLTQQEQDLQFVTFNSDTALALGLAIVESARRQQLAVTVQVARNGQVLFQHAMDGATADQAEWIRRKNNVVQRFGRSSYFVGVSAKSRGEVFEDNKHLDTRDYAAHGGAFPILVKDVGIVGTVTVSGLPQAQDHALVVAALHAHLHGV